MKAREKIRNPLVKGWDFLRYEGGIHGWWCADTKRPHAGILFLKPGEYVIWPETFFDELHKNTPAELAALPRFTTLTAARVAFKLRYGV